MEQSTRGETIAREHRLPAAWAEFLGSDMQLRVERIAATLASGGAYYPAGDIFTAFSECPPDKVKVVIVGQDPYHGEGEAHGLAFSVLPGVKIPPSLRNMFKELKTDLNWTQPPASGDLTAWARQGVLLLNSILTVKPDLAASHAGLGWEAWTDDALSMISRAKPGVVFILWGGKAHKKKALLGDAATVIQGAHPSPLSANRGGFFGGRYFSRANASLAQSGEAMVDWGAILGPAPSESSNDATAKKAEGQ